GSSSEVVNLYLESTSEKSEIKTNGPIIVEQLILKNQNGIPVNTFQPGDDIRIEIQFASETRIELPYIWISVVSQFVPVFSANMTLDRNRPTSIYGKQTISCCFYQVPLLPQQYALRMAVRDKTGMKTLLEPQEIAFFTVTGAMEDYGLFGE